MKSQDSEVAAAVRRTVGIAALRSLRRLVDENAAEEHREARWALRIGAGFLVLAGAFLVWLVRRAL